ncbi:unnamed protein product [Clonostachys rosea]|uniref:Metallo-beta-lactamase domain-containing protein n=1 Tax=Bionectria ochroleuca TaxID=29856 RepID=A0ABY6ULK5_BIOOC|nr:unnamed protein product [Clonostachys rosea]
MTHLRSAVYVAPPIPLDTPKGATWSPISCTLIYSKRSAVLVDTPITVAQNEDLVKWIKDIAPNRTLSYIYITHGHGDHWFGIPVLLKHFPEAIPLATAGTINHMKEQISDEFFKREWEFRFPSQIHKPFMLAQELPPTTGLKFYLEDQWELQVFECGHADMADSTFLWVPDLRLAVCGDVVYGQVHQMLMEANTKAKRDEWLHAIDMVRALDPLYVVAGHKRAEEIDGTWHLEATKEYIKDFEKVLQTDPKDAAEVFKKMVALYPDRFNPGALRLSAMGAFMVPKEARI